MLDQKINRRFPHQQRIEVSTVDGFQGREKKIIVISCVRAGTVHEVSRSTDSNIRSSIGFVADVRRINVALTRAKYACWVVGDSRKLRTSGEWKGLIEQSRVRGLYRPLATDPQLT